MARPAPLLGDVAATAVGGIDARTGNTFFAGENIYGPFERECRLFGNRRGAAHEPRARASDGCSATPGRSLASAGQGGRAEEAAGASRARSASTCSSDRARWPAAMSRQIAGRHRPHCRHRGHHHRCRRILLSLHRLHRPRADALRGAPPTNKPARAPHGRPTVAVARSVRSCEGRLRHPRQAPRHPLRRQSQRAVLTT